MSPTLAERVAPLDVAAADEESCAAHGPAFTSVVGLACACAPYLRQLVRSDPDRLARLASAAPEDSLAILVSRQRGIGGRFEAGEITRDEAMRELRLAKAEQALLIALADLGRAWTVDDVVAALSDFADASVDSAVRIALAEAIASGSLLPPAAQGGASGCGLVVLALGKHGARELNYSSDVDLVLFFDPGSAWLKPSGEPTRIYTRIAQSIAKLLQDRTVDGYVHRVDYRLRPDPGSTPPAVSLPAAYTYYETLGQNWERAAMIKARAIAGDVTQGERFIADLKPFIWRKYFDFGSIADIHAMKRQIHAVRGFGDIAVAGHDIKLGRGGIREIEFFVQTQQLVFGGRRPGLRGRRTLDMLGALHEEGWVSAAARDELAEAYRFLRTVEHRLQMVADEQTQRLPSQPEELARFATFCGYPDLPAFSAAMTGHAQRVQAHYGLLFEQAPELASDLGDLVFAGPAIDPGTVATLRRLGFREPENAAETVRGWHFGRRAAVTSARAREVLTELVPTLLTALGGSADPDGGLARLDAAFARMPAAVELLTVLRSHESLRVLFADLLGSAPRLADTVAATPHVLDGVLSPPPAGGVPDAREVEADLRAQIGHPEAMEEFLDAVRDAVRQVQFTAGARMLSGAFSPRETGALFASVATATVRISLERAAAAFAEEHGSVPGGRIAVLGLGRLGADDLTAGSDLDLTILYDFDPDHRASSGRRPLDAAVYHMRLTQRLVAALTVPTRRGRLYEVDLRLRPSGSKGPLATQFSGFAAYHEREAELWEHMALTRARVVAGDARFGAKVASTIATVVTRPRDARAVFASVAQMRDLVEREKPARGDWDLKLAPGGLLDLDFLAQALVLAHSAEHVDLAAASTDAVFAEAARAGIVPSGTAAELIDAFTRQNDVLHWLRLTTGGDDNAPGASTLRRLAALTGAPDEGELQAHLSERRRFVRSAFDRILRGCA